MMRRIGNNPLGKKAVLWCSVILSSVIALILWGVSSMIIQRQETQQMAERWSEEPGTAQISCFFSANTKITPDMIEELEYNLEKKLKEASVELESENPGARLWADAYSAYGKITVNSERGSITADAIGIGGDFFLFHPLKLLTGSFFSGNDLMQDYCVLDEDAAWRLFGSNNIAGQIVYVNQIPHIVTGVIERAEGRLEKAAGLDSSVIYVSYDSLEKYGNHSGINHYEIVMPDPVRDFAYNCIKELVNVSEQEVEIVDNTGRFELLNRIKLIKSFGTRSMNGKAIIYPYWENIVRGVEDILLVLTLFMILCIVYPTVVVVIVLIYKWRHRTWSLKAIWNKVKGGRL